MPSRQADTMPGLDATQFRGRLNRGGASASPARSRGYADCTRRPHGSRLYMVGMLTPLIPVSGWLIPRVLNPSDSTGLKLGEEHPGLG